MCYVWITVYPYSPFLRFVLSLFLGIVNCLLIVSFFIDLVFCHGFCSFWNKLGLDLRLISIYTFLKVTK